MLIACGGTGAASEKLHRISAGGIWFHGEEKYQ